MHVVVLDPSDTLTMIVVAVALVVPAGGDCETVGEGLQSSEAVRISA